jgi:hypothetical protein
MGHVKGNVWEVKRGIWKYGKGDVRGVMKGMWGLLEETFKGRCEGACGDMWCNISREMWRGCGGARRDM